MKALLRVHVPVLLTMVGFFGCGLELIGGNLSHQAFERPASKIRGSVALSNATLQILDADGKVIEPFQQSFDGGVTGAFEVRLPSAKYSNLVVSATSGNTSIRALVPVLGEESAIDVSLDERTLTETLITEARLSVTEAKWKQVTPEAYRATANLIQAAFDVPGPTQNLLNVVSSILSKYQDPNFGGEPIFFLTPVLNSDFTTKSSALNRGWVDRDLPDIDGDGAPNFDSDSFDELLASVARLYRPSGCPDPDQIRIVFSVDFNSGRKNGNCGVSDRFKWATDRPGKAMFFVGWLHKDSVVQDPLVAARLGNAGPNQLVMRDDGTQGDESAGDNVWTIFFDVPRGSRIGYKYTWGTRGAPWTGSEEWPGNSRIIEAVDVNGDDLVYRSDVFADEATNKDRSNANLLGNGTVEWTTNLRGGVEAREMMIDTNDDCRPDAWFKPNAVGPLTVACSQ
jgi:hypothetical protein